MFASLRTPAACLWRAFFFAACVLSVPLVVRAQPAKNYRPMPNYVQLGKPDQAEGRRLMSDFRHLGISGDYYLEFRLRMMPHRGQESVFTGRLWGGRRPEGAYTRLELSGPDGSQVRLLILNGPNPQIWRWRPGLLEAEHLGLRDLFQAIPGTVLTPFDLQMPYLYWNDYTFEGLAKVRGRPAYNFLMYPPPDVEKADPALRGVRVSIDSEYKAMVESTLIGADDTPLKRLSLQELKKVQGQWIVQMVEVRDEATRSKTRFSVTGAALGQSFADGLFSPGALARDIAPPSGGAVDRF